MMETAEHAEDRILARVTALTITDIA